MSASPDWNPTSRRSAWGRLVAADPPAWVRSHALAVEGLAVAMARRAAGRGLAVDVHQVSVGALLHDIGRAHVQDLRHASVGADLLRRPPPWPEPVCRIVETHTGAGVLPDEARAAGLPERDYVPRTLEERIVAAADNLFTGDRRLTLDGVVAKYEARGLKEAARRIEALHRELCGLLECDLEALESTRLPEP